MRSDVCFQPTARAAMGTSMCGYLLLFPRITLEWYWALGTAFGWTPAKLGRLKGVSAGEQGVGGKAHGVSKECTCLFAG